MNTKRFVPDLLRRHHHRIHPVEFYLAALVSQQQLENLKMKSN